MEASQQRKGYGDIDSTAIGCWFICCEPNKYVVADSIIDMITSSKGASSVSVKVLAD